MKLENYTLKYLTLTLLAVIPLWAGLFYVIVMEEVYDNIDDGLKNSKILIIRQAYADKNILDTPRLGINRFTITPLPQGSYSYKEEITTAKEFMEYDNDYEPVRVLTTIFDDAEGKPHRLEIRSSMVEEDELLEDLAIALFGLYIMLVLTILFFNRIILRRIWKSFYATLTTLKQYKVGSGGNFTPVETNIDEFKTLAREVKEMLVRNEEIYSSQKQFIENAAHELQTPLAISLNKLELLAENNSNLDEQQMNEIGKIADTLNRLVRLNKSLLMLSKIENRQFAEEKEINFNELARKLVNDFYDLADYKNISLSIEERAQLLHNMNGGLAITLLNNLIKNAIIHNYPNGMVHIIIDSTSIAVTNTGIAQPLNENYIFNRFARNVSSEQSTGLGLSLVKSITAIYSLKIKYSFDGNHTFTVNFS
ncbi:sensor histidine kinase KdpD [Flavobacterium sp. MK4S-17]|uniref:sensor histidine kinase n=1 Tax=Flavobacterium sp. MK4S-17 TaxID=2543737 RepID=UPI00135A7DE2|nr:HAMP domain-containing sensor histidine kinase [Flavobacterium sp. MK4S-17]